MHSARMKSRMYWAAQLAEGAKGKPAHGRTRKQTSKATGKAAASPDRDSKGKGRASRPQAGGGRKYRKGGSSSDYGHNKSTRKEPVSESPRPIVTKEAIGYSAAKLTRQLGLAYNAVMEFKGMLDTMEEIPNSLRRAYDRTGKIAEHTHLAKAQAFQSQMELRRILR